MKHLICDGCAKDPQLYGTGIHEGSREVLGASAEGPAESMRVVKGMARTPTAEQRVMFINEAPFPLPRGHFDCDHCNAPIHPGDPAWCVTVWVGRREPEPWEDTFVSAS